MICRVEAMSEHSTGGPDHDPEYVFGYGSLVAEQAGCHTARLRGHRRVWGVAMDNTVDLPGYKSYRLRSDGSRPAVFVAFLDIEPDARTAVTGVCMPVDAAMLRELDDRERNYARVDVTDAIVGARGRVWAYRGSDAGRARLREGLARGCAVVSRDYLARASAAIAAIAPDEVAEIEPVSARDRFALLDLQRIEIPHASGPPLIAP
jgi:hypothetical protein